MSRILSFPWRFDRHTHVSLYAALRSCPSLAGLGRWEALALLKKLPAERVSLVLGWHSGHHAFTPEDLETLPPILLVNASLHGLALTPAARRRLLDSEPELVQRHQDAAWCERSLPRLMALYARFARLTPGNLDGFMQELQLLGIGAAEDMLLTDAQALEVMAASPWAGRLRYWATPEVFHSLSVEARRGLEGLKLFTDGALGARTAALSVPYRTGSEGLLLHSDEGLWAELAGLHSLGMPLAIHAIGDRAIEQVLLCLEVLDSDGLRFPAVRLEHAQFITEPQARRARDLGITLSMQPNFNSDSVDYADRLEASWLARNNPFRMLIDACGFRPGEDLLFGSDGMPHGLEYALQWSLFPPFEGQRLSLEELLAGYGVQGEGEGGSFQVEIDEERRRVACAFANKLE